MTIICPVCGLKTEVDSLPNPDTDCPKCTWGFDVYQYENHDAKGCVNIMSVNEARKAYAEGKEIY